MRFVCRTGDTRITWIPDRWREPVVDLADVDFGVMGLSMWDDTEDRHWIDFGMDTCPRGVLQLGKAGRIAITGSRIETTVRHVKIAEMKEPSDQSPDSYQRIRVEFEVLGA